MIDDRYQYKIHSCRLLHIHDISNDHTPGKLVGGGYDTTKFLLKLKSFANSPASKKPKYCATCANLATIEASYDVGEGITAIEKYCDKCSKRVSSSRV
ncbi:MAG: hypothetical protein ACREAZ_07715 [Nitrososphaera sp.]